MINKIYIILLWLIPILILVNCASPQKREETGQQDEKTFEANWESLKEHNEEPDWLKDAKLGIYFHWGVYSVPAFGSEWYPRNMHFEDHDVYKYHVENYGHPSEFGYHDFVPMFKAENFDAGEWAALFKKAGAKFAGPVAEHHDGFAMWDSEATPWNVADKGPNKDITGQLEEAIREQGMKFITTFHHAKQLQRYKDSVNEQEFEYSHYPYFEGMPPREAKGDLKYLYGNLREDRWLDAIWFGKLKEVIDQYHPDIIWFDYVLDKIPESYRKKFCAYYLNHTTEENPNPVIVHKQEDLPLEVSIEDFEKSRKTGMSERLWMTDNTVSKGSWSYTKDLDIKTADFIIHELIDITSKNGVLLLNVSPKADGNIPQNQQEVLLKMGKWLDQYGEAIYGTRPWYTFGEGPTKEPEGGFESREEFLGLEYSYKDVRYTTKDNVIYAIMMGVPEDDMVLEAFADEQVPKAIEVGNVSLLGNEEQVEWELNNSGLKLSQPEKAQNEMAVVYKININEK